MYMVPFIWYLVLISESSAEFSDDSTTCFPAFPNLPYSVKEKLKEENQNRKYTLEYYMPGGCTHVGLSRPLSNTHTRKHCTHF